MTMGAYDKVAFRGVTINKRTRAMIWSAEDNMTRTLDIYQGSYSTAVSASALTHAGGGVLDCWPRGGDVAAAHRAVRRLRDVGFAAWVRTPEQGFSYHIHAVAIGDATLSGPEGSPTYPYGATYQVDAYLDGLDGLADKAPDPQPYRPAPPVVFDYRAYVAKQSRLRTAVRTLASKVRRLKTRQRALARQIHNH